ncbi:hypothetical protein F442_19487 [Phytophthora nicotianae P10297]|uniref:Uncharacterized protein n=1 Tax=Phytophthora nicotianae P10297 TaxID=1317064 RepID=W2YBT4_PHYNI|nr:hypothetical protein F442_19487 [Phytophthora nicotianae P10297]
MPANKSTAPCGGCGESVGSVHRCPTYSCHMHLFCARPIGDEGFGQSVVCPGCEGSGGASSNTSEIVLATNTVTNAIELLDSDFDIKPDSDADADSDVNTNSSQRQSSQTHQPPRHIQIVSSVAHHRKVVRWMNEHEAIHGEKGMFSKAVDQFSALFYSATRAANLAKAVDW